MGTRNLTCVFADGEYRVANYGQWDGYPEGQGIVALNFIKECNLTKLREVVKETSFVTDDFVEEVYKRIYAEREEILQELNVATKNLKVAYHELKSKDDLDAKIALEAELRAKLNAATGKAELQFNEEFPQFSRDTGARVLQHLYEGKVKQFSNSIDFAVDSLFCEWAYIIDLDKNTFEIYKGFNKEQLNPEERFYTGLEVEASNSGSRYYPIKLAKSYDLGYAQQTLTEEEFVGDLKEKHEDEEQDDES